MYIASKGREWSMLCSCQIHTISRYLKSFLIFAGTKDAEWNEAIEWVDSVHSRKRTGDKGRTHIKVKMRRKFLWEMKMEIQNSLPFGMGIRDDYECSPSLRYPCRGGIFL